MDFLSWRAMNHPQMYSRHQSAPPKTKSAIRASSHMAGASLA